MKYSFKFKYIEKNITLRKKFNIKNKNVMFKIQRKFIVLEKIYHEKPSNFRMWLIYLLDKNRQKMDSTKQREMGDAIG